MSDGHKANSSPWELLKYLEATITPPVLYQEEGSCIFKLFCKSRWRLTMQIYHLGCHLNTRLSPHYVNRARSSQVTPLWSVEVCPAPLEVSFFCLASFWGAPHGARGGGGNDWMLWEYSLGLEEQVRKGQQGLLTRTAWGCLQRRWGQWVEARCICLIRN